MAIDSLLHNSGGVFAIHDTEITVQVALEKSQGEGCSWKSSDIEPPLLKIATPQLAGVESTFPNHAGDPQDSASKLTLK
jgi:hypothetical protein